MSTKIWVWYAGASGDGYVRLKLRAGEPALHTFHGGRDEEGRLMPAWETAENGQRDFSAEATRY